MLVASPWISSCSYMSVWSHVGQSVFSSFSVTWLWFRNTTRANGSGEGSEWERVGVNSSRYIYTEPQNDTIKWVKHSGKIILYTHGSSSEHGVKWINFWSISLGLLQKTEASNYTMLSYFHCQCNRCIIFKNFLKCTCTWESVAVPSHQIPGLVDIGSQLELQRFWNHSSSSHMISGDSF